MTIYQWRTIEPYSTATFSKLVTSNVKIPKNLWKAAYFRLCLEMFYLNTIELLFLFVEQLDQLEVCLPHSRLLTGIPILAVFQNLRRNSNKTSYIFIHVNWILWGLLFSTIEMFYLNSTLNFGIPPVLVFQLDVYYKIDRLLTGLTAQQKETTARWYSNKTNLPVN